MKKNTQNVTVHLLLFAAVLTIACSAGVRAQENGGAADQSPSGEGTDSRESGSGSLNPRFEDQFNCLCQIEVNPSGEIDMSANCGKNLANCSCGFSEQMRRDLSKMDRKGLNRLEQIERMKEMYSKYKKRVLAVPDPAGAEYALGYVVPPAVLFLGLLFVGALGWYVLMDRSGEEGVEPEGPVSDSGDAIEREIEQEIQKRRDRI